MSAPVVAYLGLGSNLGNRQRNIERAVELLRSGAAHPGSNRGVPPEREQAEVTRVSSIYETAPVGYTKQPNFLNAVCAVRTTLSPQELRAFSDEIESYMGRVPANVPQGPRSLDIDLLLYGDTTINTPRLTVPHPRMHERGFVLVPLAEIAPEARHPVLGKTARELLAALGPVQGVARFDPEDAYWKGLKRGKRPVPPIVPPQ